MPRVPRNLIEHSLNVDPKATPKRQHLHRFADNRRDAIKKELAKLLAAGFIREVFHSEWLANPILVRKKNTNEWRMCVNYTDLKKHCPKDPFGLPRVDQVIDSTAGCDLLCFIDCYSGYPPDCYQGRRPGEDRVHHPIWCLLLHDHVVVKTRNSDTLMWMMWSSRPETPTRSSPIFKTLSLPCESTARSSTRTSSPSAYLRENYSASSSAIVASKPTPRRSQPSSR
jgi:hypothetical protein